MKKILFYTMICVFTWLALPSSEARAQVAAGLSNTTYNRESRTVAGYSGTYVDYRFAYYYTPSIDSWLYIDDENPISTKRGWGYNSTLGFLDGITVFHYTNLYIPGITYCTDGIHKLRANYFYTAYSMFFDPYRFNLFAPTYGGPWSGYPYGYYYAAPSSYYIGYTRMCRLVPPDGPTPTPPPPTPTPTPCDFSAPDSCQEPTFELRIASTDVRPSGVTGGGNPVQVEVQTIPALANKEVRFELNLGENNQYVNSGGHVDNHHTGSRPLGRLGATRGTTDASGIFRTKYYPPHIGGKVLVNAYMFGRRAAVTLTISVPGLQLLPAGANYERIGGSDSHPTNHYGTSSANQGLINIANDYKDRFYGQNPIPENDKLRYNDMSLEYGGKFELAARWSNVGSHSEHREGINTDVRCCASPGNVPQNRWQILNQVFNDRGSTRTLDETHTAAPHWHLRFEFGGSQATYTDSEFDVERLPSAVTTTPGQYVENAWWGMFDREATNEEWLQGKTRLETAKAQGQLLSEASAYLSENFLSDRYSSRNRTADEFIYDVFNTYLMREPTAAEVSYWRHRMNMVYGPQTVKRMRLLQSFGSTAEFADVIGRLVDEPQF